jgi:hypothetical protein
MTHNPRPALRWERSKRGTLFLRRQPKFTLGVIIANVDRTFSWLSRAYHQDEPSRYPTEAAACDALLTVLGL